MLDLLGRRDEEEVGPGLWLGVAGMLAVGVVLGLLYNQIGLTGQPAWGLAWVATDPVEELAALDMVELPDPPGAPATVSDDPLAPPPGAVPSALPEIPAVGRPVKIPLAVMKLFVDQQAAMIVDAREPEEFVEAHVPGALNLPYDLVVTDPARLESLDTGGRPIIVYCGGGGCELSLQLANELLFAGHERVAIYEGGFPEWVGNGYPVQAGEGG